MPDTAHRREAPWGDSPVERLSFGLSEKQPIRAIRNRWSDKETFWYDMHYSVELGVLLCGRMTRQYRDLELNLSPGDVWLCNMWEPHGFRITQAPCEIVFFEVFPPMLAKTHFPESSETNWLAPFFARPSCRPWAGDPETRERVLGVAQDLADPLGESGGVSGVRLRLKLFEILLTIGVEHQCVQAACQPPVDSFEKINKAIQMVFESTRRVTTQAAAKACGMNRNAFARLFADVMGVGYSDFSLRCRISAAAQQLREGTAPVKAIAMQWGFTDDSHLHRCFKRHYGCSPAAYRRRG